ncbi:hypothetical protein V5O48_010959 [Marasmius crinis-equi]|uniref:C2H2-type domain-containing protein n=1 Tax=Marasmius crinis-equi TaxID=585013 RepID=A0ABR3F6Z1_9AGAR
MSYGWDWWSSLNFTLGDEHEEKQHAPPQHEELITEHFHHADLSSPSPLSHLALPDEDEDVEMELNYQPPTTSEEYDYRIRDMNRLASLERNYYSTFFCCTLKLPSFHALLEHIERVHVTVVQGARYYRPVGTIAGTTPVHDNDDDETEETEERASQWPWYSPGEFAFGRELQFDQCLGLDDPESDSEPSVPAPTTTATTHTHTTTPITTPQPAVVPLLRSPLSLSIPERTILDRNGAHGSDSDTDSDASTPSLSPSPSPSSSPSPPPSPATPSVSPVSLTAPSLSLPTPPISPSTKPYPHPHPYPPTKKHTNTQPSLRRRATKDEGRYRYRCPTVGCIKAYLNPNGLKYHREKGKCSFE